MTDWMVLCTFQSQEEGIVVKDLTSPYILGQKSRSLQHFIKMKPDYSDEAPSLDLIVLGAYYADSGMRAGMLSRFLLGVIDKPVDKNHETDSMQPRQGPLAFLEGEEEDEGEMDKGRVMGPKSGVTKPLSSKFYTIGRCGSGLTMDELNRVHEILKGKWKKWQGVPAHFMPWRPSKHDIPDAWIDPKDSIILEVRCAELVKSDAFSAGYTLR